MHYIDGQWKEGSGEDFSSFNPATKELIWTGKAADQQEVDAAVRAARSSFPSWSRLPFEERIAYLRTFEGNLKKHQQEFAELISKESGKPLWESNQEVASMIQKIGISIEAYQERCPQKKLKSGDSTITVHHKPHGVAAVFGPFNFPGHLPNGHIVPALLAGNTIVFKGSEFTPAVSEQMIKLWAGLPKGVLNLVQGGPVTGRYLLNHPQIDGLFFTGSYQTGRVLLDALTSHPEKILALEMGGNNPLVIRDISNLEAAAHLTIQSAFLTAGQRCTCARRLILSTEKEADEFLKVLIQMTKNIKIGPYTMRPEPFMGPVISLKSAEKLLAAESMLESQGGISLLRMHQLEENTPFLAPGIMDVTQIENRKDEELFGPFLQVIRVPSFEAAIQEANNTAYGLVASIFTKNRTKYERFYQEIRAGVINWNMPTTGASGKAPFGGVGKSGNFRPGGYYAADYCSYPVASMENEEISIKQKI